MNVLATARGSSNPRDSKGNLRLWGEVFGLLVVLVPIVGVGVRAIAFSLDDRLPDHFVFWTSVPLGVLATTGFFAILPVMFTIPWIYFLIRTDAALRSSIDMHVELTEEGLALDDQAQETLVLVADRYELSRQGDELRRGLYECLTPDERADAARRIRRAVEGLGVRVDALKDTMDRYEDLSNKHQELGERLDSQTRWLRPAMPIYRRKPVRGTVGLALVAAFVALLVWVPAWPGFHISAMGSILVALWLARRLKRRAGETTLGEIWPAVVGYVLSAVLAAGMAAQVTGAVVGLYGFQSGVAPEVGTGAYASLGVVDGLTYLAPCEVSGGGRATVAYGIRSEDIAYTTPLSISTSRSLYEVVFTGAPVLVTVMDRCPGPDDL